jgi:hypothetical protein
LSFCGLGGSNYGLSRRSNNGRLNRFALTFNLRLSKGILVFGFSNLSFVTLTLTPATHSIDHKSQNERRSQRKENQK